MSIEFRSVLYQSEITERHKEISKDLESILDEIDEVLEENSEEFVRSYVQKGGQ